MFDWAVAGVNVSIPGEGGPECAAFMPMHIRIFESVVALGIALRVIISARYNPSFKNIPRLPRSKLEILGKHKSLCHNTTESLEQERGPGVCKHVENETRHETNELIKENKVAYSSLLGRKNSNVFESLSDRNNKNWLLVLLCLVWGAEIGFKFASRTVIFLLNPCHVVTAVQIYLLAAEPSHKVTIMFRFHLYFLNGAILAFLFPNTESRIRLVICGLGLFSVILDGRFKEWAHPLLPCESSLYWIQHTTMLVVPIYLLCLRGVYNVEPIRDLSWGVVGFSVNMVYHFAFLQPIALISEVNLNQLLCPAQLDPFRGVYYRTAALIHQSILCLLVAKACCISASFLTSTPVYSEQSHRETDAFSCDKNSCQTSEKATMSSSLVFECESCLEKEVAFADNANKGMDDMISQFTNSENKEDILKTDNGNPSKECNESDFQLRQRNASEDGNRL